MLLLFLLLFARFFYLQVSQREHYHTLAEANRISIAPIVPNRGLIFDRNGEVLAHNYSAYTLEIVPSKVDEPRGSHQRVVHGGRDSSRETASVSRN